MNYSEFLNKKKKLHIESGFKETEFNSNLFPFQEQIVKTALIHGKYAIFADCGLGKTIIQLEWASKVVKQTNKPVLILAPLAVSGQTIKEGEKFGIHIEKWTIGNQALISVNHTKGIFITNYEQLENIDTAMFSGIVLDESSILKNFTGKLKQLIIDSFKNTPYKLACTATPSPNDPMELGNHSEFLDVMGRNEMLAMYFVHDSGETAKWRIKGHAVDAFYSWVSTWAVMISKPQDLGFEMEGYDLPKLNLIEKVIKTPKRDNGELFNDAIVSATNFNRELRLTKVSRLDQVVEIVNSKPNENFIIWIKQNEEGDYLRKLIPDAIEVKGSDKSHIKEDRLLGFGNDEFRVLITKTKIAQFGLNYQNCRNQIFASLDFSFESLYQAIRRSYRFGQKNEVNIYIITTDTMKNVIQSINNKRKQFEKMQKEMNSKVAKSHKVKAAKSDPVKTDDYQIYNGDGFKLINDIKDQSIDYSIFSPPFSSLYTFSDSLEDLSNCVNHDEFYKQFEFIVPELLRVTKDGRLCSLHVMQLTTSIGRDGYLSIIDFRGDIIRLFQKNGWVFHAEVTIWKSPELAAIRTKNIQLLHKQTTKDSAVNRPGLADYLITFRKKGINKEPINKGHGIPFKEWTKIASPVWLDISESDVITYRTGRDSKDERHITPTQLSVIERALKLWSNKGDTILSPFAGIGSEGYQSIKMGRKFIGLELKTSYFDLMTRNLNNAVSENSQLEMFA